MTVKTKFLEFSTQGNAEIVDITHHINGALSETGLVDGTVTIFVPGATGGLTTVEYESGLIEDLDDLWERIAPSSASYKHDQTWHDGNGHSHVRASMLGPSITIPFVSGELTLGTWQQVIFVDFDVRSRSRRLVIQCMGK